MSAPINYKKLTTDLYTDINKIRENPQSLIPYLKKIRTFYRKNHYNDPSLTFTLITKEGVTAVDETIKYLEKQAKTPVLKKNENLELSTTSLLSKIGPKGLTKHEKGDLSLKSRTEKYLKKKGKLAENISFGMNRSLDIIAQMLIDDGVSSRGHRKNFFDANFSDIGISTGKHDVYGSCAIFNFYGQGSGELFDRFFIGKEEWPQDAVSVEQRCRVGTLEGRRKVFLEYVFRLGSGEEVVREKEFEEEVV